MSKLETTLDGLNNGENLAILTGKNENFDYNKDGKKTSDTPIGFKYTAVLPGSRLSAITVKIAGADQLANITDEQINEALAAKKFIWVKFTNCKVTIYNIGESMIMSALAKGIELAKPESAKPA